LPVNPQWVDAETVKNVFVPVDAISHVFIPVDADPGKNVKTHF